MRMRWPMRPVMARPARTAPSRATSESDSISRSAVGVISILPVRLRWIVVHYGFRPLVAFRNGSRAGRELRLAEDQAGGVDDEPQRAIAEDRRTREPLPVSKKRPERLHDDVLFAQQAVDEECDLAIAMLCCDDEAAAIESLRSRISERAAEVNYREKPASQQQRRVPTDGTQVCVAFGECLRNRDE